MDIEKLVERLKNAAGGPDGIKMCQQAATALSTLRAENEKLRAELEKVKAENTTLSAAMLTIAVNGCYDILDVNWLEKCLDRLAAYEDTGLEPEEIIELKGRMEGLEK